MSTENVGEKKTHHQGIAIAEVIPLKGMRKKIAEHMLQSHLQKASLSSLMETDVTTLVAFRKELNSRPERTGGLKISFTHLVIKAIAQALRKYPAVNSSLIGEEIYIWEDINIGVAVSLPAESLIVPVVMQADKKNILEIAQRMMDLEARARIGKLNVADVQKGTITLTNIGGLMPIASWQCPIINQAQCAILGTMAIKETPVVRDGQIVIRSVMPITITFDHRILNGLPVANFCQELAQILENPTKLELGI